MSDEKIYKLIKAFVFLLGLIPDKILMFVSDILGLVWYLIDKRHRNIAIKNLQTSFPKRFAEKKSIKRFAKKNFQHIISIVFDSIRLYSKSEKDLFEHFVIQGLENFENAKKKGKGVVFLSCHLGNFELLMPALAKVGISGAVVYRKLDFNPLELLLLEIRQRFGTTMIPLRGASKKLEIILKDNGVVGSMLDQNVDWYHGVFMDFFKKAACTNNGLAKLVLKSKAVVIPIFIMKRNKKFIVNILPQIPLQDTNDLILDIENNTQNYVSAIEFMVRQCPEQYFWVHDRWKTKPFCLLKSND